MVSKPMEEHVYQSPSKQASLTTPARMILNYKNINYKTEWTEYPDLAPKFKSL